MGFGLIARLLYGGRILGEVRVPPARGLRVGEAGDLVVPGVAAHSLLAIDDRRCAVPGLLGPAAGPQALDDVTTLTLEAHPDVTIELERVATPKNPFRRGLLRLPVRELAYGLGLALGLAGFVTVKVAVSPAPTKERDDESEIVRAMLAAPVATYELPPIPVVATAMLDDASPGDGQPAPDGERGRGIERDEEPEADEPLPVVTQVEVEAKPQPVAPPAKKKRRRKRGKKKKKSEEPELTDAVAVVKVLGTMGGDSGTVFDVIESQEGSLGAMFSSGMTTTLANTVAESELPVVEETEQAGVGIAASGSPGTLPVPAGVERKSPPSSKGDEGTDPVTKAGCDAKPDPKSQVDVVFVVDASGGMGEALASLSAQVSGLDSEISQYDRAPHYGVVAFVDELDVRGGGKPLSGVGEVEKELDRLLLRAGTNRQPDGAASNDEAANNGLDALHAAATAFDWRDEADTLRLVVYASAAPTGARGTELSGRKVRHGYGAVVRALADESIRVASFTGAAAKAGFRGKRGGQASIPDQTAGSAFSLDGLVSGRSDLRGSLAKLLTNPVCERGLFD